MCTGGVEGMCTYLWVCTGGVLRGMCTYLRVCTGGVEGDVLHTYGCALGVLRGMVHSYGCALRGVVYIPMGVHWGC